MDTETLVATAAVVLTTYLFTRWYKDPIRRIPGPPGLPVIGNTFSLQPKKLHMQFYDLAKEFGPIFKVKVFHIPVVVVNSLELSMDALVKKGTDFAGRPPSLRVQTVVPDELVFSTFDEKNDCAKKRQLFFRALKSYGSGLHHLDDLIQNTIADVVETLHTEGNNPIDLKELSIGYLTCMLRSLVFGERRQYTELERNSLHQLNIRIADAIDVFGTAAILDFVPSLFNRKFLFPSAHHKIENTRDEVRKFAQTKIDEAMNTLDKENPRGCLDQLLILQETENLTDSEVRGLLMDFVITGLESSERSLTQMLLQLVSNPTMTKRIQTQIDEQFSPTHNIDYKERSELPLLEAFIEESFRHLSVLPFLGPHYTIRDTELAGYQIPAETVVIINYFSMAHNPEVYEDPFTFNLDRFLDKNGQFVTADHPARTNVIQFGKGKRHCPAEHMARSRIFIFLASILQKFDLEASEEMPKPDPCGYRLTGAFEVPSATAKFTRRQQ